MKDLAIVDVETTGTNPISDRVIEIGIVLASQDTGSTTTIYSSLINPHRSISPIITSITGITQADLISAPTFADIYTKLIDLLGERVFVAHNARFDYAFLKHEFARLGVNFQTPQLCSVKLSRRLYPEHRRHGLDKIIERFGLDCPNRHRALGDAQAVWEFLTKSRHLHPRKYNKAVKDILEHPALPTHLDHQLITDLPQSPGVYIFYDKHHEPLYVGKSVNIKDRVASHFYSDLRINKELRIKEKIHHIETTTTAGELTALLTESHLVKELKPHYNSMLKRRRFFQFITLDPDSDGYLRVTHKRQNHLDPRQFGHIYGLFKSRRSADTALRSLAKDHHLCFKLMCLEKTRGPCFASHLDICQGACTGKESQLTYNMRIQTALSAHKLASWPFTGPIAISEHNQDTDQFACQVFDFWTHLATVNDPSDLDSLSLKGKQLVFDYDVYQILKHHLRKPGIHISPLSQTLGHILLDSSQ